MPITPTGTVQGSSNVPLGLSEYERILAEHYEVNFNPENVQVYNRCVQVLPKSSFAQNTADRIETKTMLGAGPAAAIPEFNGAMRLLNMYESYKYVTTSNEFGAQAIISRKAADDGSAMGYFDLIQKYMDAVVQAPLMNRIQRTFNIWNNAANPNAGSSVPLASDGRPILSQDHRWSDQFDTPYSNVFPGNVSYENVRQFIVQMQTQVDHLGNPLYLIKPGDTIDVECTPADERFLQEYFSSPGNPNNNFNVINTLKSTYTFNVNANPWLKALDNGRRPVLFFLKDKDAGTTNDRRPLMLIEWPIDKKRTHVHEITNAQGGYQLSCYDRIGFMVGNVNLVQGLGYLTDSGTVLGDA